MTELTLFHRNPRGSYEKPEYGRGKVHNDYGSGFYCTRHAELAREWACPTEGRDGFCNRYRLETEGLQVLDLSTQPYTVLHWLAVLVEYRVFDVKTPIAIAGKQYLHERFLPPVDEYDVVVGHRADDSYFSFARAFLRNGISLEQLERAMRLGDLGLQVVLKSPRAFERIAFEGAEAVSAEVYYPRRLERDERARQLYCEEAQRLGIGGVYMRDILEGRATDYEGL